MALRVLLVEDNPGDRFLVVELLTEQFPGVLIEQCADGKSAEALLMQQPFDVLLLDLTLPDSAPAQTIRKASEWSKKCPVIVLTGFSDPDAISFSLQGGVQDYLPKDEINAALLQKSIQFAQDRQKFSLALEHSEQKFRSLIENSLDGIMTISPEKVVLDVSGAFTKILGYTREEYILQDHSDLIHPDFRELVDQSFEEVLKYPDRIRSIRYQFKTKSGNYIWVESSFHNQLNNPAVKAIVLNFRDITDKIFQEKELEKQREQQQKTILQNTIRIQEKERREISGELHDNVNQLLASAQLMIDHLRENGEFNARWLEKASDGIKLAINEIRQLSHRLAPSALIKNSLQESIEDLMESIFPNNNNCFSLSFDQNIHDQLNPDLQLNLYRIVQEQLNNIRKYAEATEILISLAIENQQLRLTITDNGKGFYPNQKTKGIGLENIQDRARLFGGNMDIQSAPGKGCTVVVTIPMTPQLEENSVAV